MDRLHISWVQNVIRSQNIPHMCRETEGLSCRCCQSSAQLPTRTDVEDTLTRRQQSTKHGFTSETSVTSFNPLPEHRWEGKHLLFECEVKMKHWSGQERYRMKCLRRLWPFMLRLLHNLRWTWTPAVDLCTFQCEAKQRSLELVLLPAVPPAVHQLIEFS